MLLSRLYVERRIRRRTMTPYDYRKISFFQEDIKNFNLRTVYLGLTDLCNHDCAWCFTRMSRRKFQATLEEKAFNRLVKDMRTLGVKGVILSGEGEPTMCPYFGKALLELTKHFSVGLKTNGGLLHKYNMNVLQQLRFLRISLDAYTKEQHEKWHGSKDWNKICEFIKAFPDQNKLQLDINQLKKWVKNKYILLIEVENVEMVTPHQIELTNLFAAGHEI